MKKIVYGVAIFIAGLMVAGLIINYLPIRSPLNNYNVCLVFWMLALGYSVYLIKTKVKLNLHLPWRVASLFILPAMAIGGAELVNYTQSNVILMVMLALLVVIPLLVIFTKFIPEEYYSFTIWIVALSLVLHRALITNYLYGSDIVQEWRYANITLLYGKWIRNIGTVASGYDTTLSSTILPVMLSKIFFISTEWVLKVIFPVFLSFIPVAVYEIVKRVFNHPKIVFLGVFTAVASYNFYSVYLQVGKQIIAMLFMSSFLLVMFDDDIKGWKRYSLMAFLGLGVIVSHYSMAILFAGIICGVYILNKVFRKKSPVSVLMVIGFVGSLLIWYMVINHYDHAALQQQVSISTKTVATISQSDGILGSNEALRLIFMGSQNMPMSLEFLYLVTQVFIVAGFVLAVVDYFKNKEKKSTLFQYLSIVVLLFGIFGLEAALPQFSQIVSMDRIYVFFIMFLMPLAFYLVWRLNRKLVIGLSVLFVSLYLFYNSGFIYQLAGQPLPTAVSISQKALDFPVFSGNELNGAEWAVNNLKPEDVYYDGTAFEAINYAIVKTGNYQYSEFGTWLDLDKVGGDTVMAYGRSNIPAGSYIYLDKYNVEEKKLSLTGIITLWIPRSGVDMSKLGMFTDVLKTSNVVYQNSDCEILKTSEGYVW